MNPKEAIALIQSLQNIAIQKGLFADVQTVNQVSAAIAALQAIIPE